MASNNNISPPVIWDDIQDALALLEDFPAIVDKNQSARAARYERVKSLSGHI